MFPSDHLPRRIIKYPTCFIANIDSSSEPGSHWVAFFLSFPMKLEFFDSYGNAPAFYEGPISDFVSNYTYVDFNPMTLQSNVTAVCGQYCIYYLYARCRGLPLKTIVSSFINNHICNDKRVYNFVWKHFKIRENFYQY